MTPNSPGGPAANATATGAAGTALPPPRIVGIGGTMRHRSITERALQHALAHAATLGAETELIDGAALNLDPYDPNRRERSAAAARLVASLQRCDGVLVATPSYHGSLSGLLKNALDYVEDLRGDVRPYLEGRAVGCIVVTDGVQAIGSTLLALRSIVHALRGWPTPYAAAVESRAGAWPDDDQTPPPDTVRDGLQRVAAQVVEFARMRQAFARLAGPPGSI